MATNGEAAPGEWGEECGAGEAARASRVPPCSARRTRCAEAARLFTRRAGADARDNSFAQSLRGVAAVEQSCGFRAVASVDPDASFRLVSSISLFFK